MKKAYVILLLDDVSPIAFNTIFTSRDKAIEYLHKFKDDYNKVEDHDAMEKLSKHTPYEVDEINGEVFCICKWYTCSYSSWNKYRKVVAMIQECELNEEK